MTTPESFLDLPAEEQAATLQRLGPKEGAAVLRETDSRSLRDAMRLLGAEKLTPILVEIPPDDLADLFVHIPASERDALLAAVGPDLAADVRRLLEYAPDTAGGMMSTRYASVPGVFTVLRALDAIREASRIDAVSYIYSTDAGGKLTGTVPVRALLLANPDTRIQDLVARAIVKLAVRDPRETVLASFRQNHFVALPVVDDHDRLVGVVTADDAVAAEHDRADELAYSATGVDAREPLMNTVRAARSRVPWITVTILGGLGCAAVAGAFRPTLERLVVLGLFMPIVLGLAEAVTAQTTAIVTRTLLGGGAGLGRFLAKEVMVGVLVGAYAGTVVGAVSLAWHGRGALGLAIGSAIAASISWAALVAVLVPLGLRRFKVEPSVAGGPVALTLADLSTLAIYFGVAALVPA
ncbi:MAG: magnesium transporter [Planctomycetes bacterium]|nr:magnesium transporter [Planctomycetota bacterium]